MSAAKRVQRTRTKHGGIPVGARYVGRPGKWGNPWKAVDGGISAAQAVQKYREWVVLQIKAGVLDLDELVGLDLACWCARGAPCHGDVLIELAQPVHGGPRR